jgi:hypothetical protein
MVIALVPALKDAAPFAGVALGAAGYLVARAVRPDIDRSLARVPAPVVPADSVAGAH